MQQGLNQVFHPGSNASWFAVSRHLYVEHISVIFNQEAWEVNPSAVALQACRQRHPVRCCCVLTRCVLVQQPCAAQQQWRSWVPKLPLHCFQGKDVNRTVSCHSSKDLRGNRRKLPSCSTSTTLGIASHFTVWSTSGRNQFFWSFDMESNPLATSLNSLLVNFRQQKCHFISTHAIKSLNVCWLRSFTYDG